MAKECVSLLLAPAVIGCAMNGRCLNLPAIEASLRAVEKDFPRINELLQCRREDMADEIVANMMAGYQFVDQLVAERSKLFAMGHLRWMLELNALVLCGREARERERHAAHLAATEQHFYGDRDGGIRDVVEWYELHKSEPVWKRAAGVYIRVLSEPQLFIEGNHRTGALIMSRILAMDSQPPFVLSIDNAQAYFDPSTLISKTRKHGLAMLFRMPKLKKQFARFLEAQADDRYLLDGAAACAAENPRGALASTEP
jgi:hypothetical protein